MLQSGFNTLACCGRLVSTAGAAATTATDQPLLHVVLVHPVIPSNTGAAGRTCLGFGAALHLVEPLGFDLSDKRVKRAGLDYWPHVNLRTHKSWKDLRVHLAKPPRNMGAEQLFFVTKFAKRSMLHADFASASHCPGAQNQKGIIAPGDCSQPALASPRRPIALIFGSEQMGLSSISDQDEDYATALSSEKSLGNSSGCTLVGLPMCTDTIRSYNLSSSIAIVLWEAWRQLNNNSS